MTPLRPTVPVSVPQPGQTAAGFTGDVTVAPLTDSSALDKLPDARQGKTDGSQPSGESAAAGSSPEGAGAAPAASGNGDQAAVDQPAAKNKKNEKQNKNRKEKK
jgi:hypothetical protein